MKYIKVLLVIAILILLAFFGYQYSKNTNYPTENNISVSQVVNDEDLSVQIVETKISNVGSCRSIGSMNDVYPPGKYQFTQEYVRDTSWKCVGGGYGGDMFNCSGKEVPLSRVRAQIGDVIDVCRVFNHGSISEPKWELDIDRNNSSPALSIPLSYVKKVPDTTPLSN